MTLPILRIDRRRDREARQAAAAHNVAFASRITGGESKGGDEGQQQNSDD
jgi:hypothetical protein